MGIYRLQRVRCALPLLLVCLAAQSALLKVQAANAQSFDTFGTNPSTYVNPGYPIVFVASFRDPDTCDESAPGTSCSPNPDPDPRHDSLNNGGNLGTDVIDIGSPSNGQVLMYMRPDNGAVERLFPIPSVHQSIVDYPIVDPSTGAQDPIQGSVTEPSISIDGKTVYFTYFHKARFPDYGSGGGASTGYSGFVGWSMGADIYSIDLTPKLNNPNFPVSQLVATRHTMSPPDVYSEAINPGISSFTQTIHGLRWVNGGAVEVDTPYGRRLYFHSNRRMAQQSNSGQTKKNFNYNIFSAEIGADGFLKNVKQAMYFTTTSGVSPARMRNGFSFSYQAVTGDARGWQIQVMEPYFVPGWGYGYLDTLAHLQTFCRRESAAATMDGLATILYYNINNNGFGQPYFQDTAYFGKNRYDRSLSTSLAPEMVGSYYLANVNGQDFPSPVGKFTTPSCGLPNQILMAYDPVTANHKNQTHKYDQTYIVLKDLEPVSATFNQSLYHPVIKASGASYQSWIPVWPRAVIPWNDRVGDPPTAHPTQDSTPVIDPETSIAAGSPKALLGTSNLYTTDITPVDCKVNQRYYNPYETSNAIYEVFDNVANMSKVFQDSVGASHASDVNNNLNNCKLPSAADIFGVAINLTSNKISSFDNDKTKTGYYLEGDTYQYAQQKETRKLLGVIAPGANAPSDTSFMAQIPANAPWEFMLLDKHTGLKLTEMLGWHSLQARETRNDCGGCHGHKVGQGIPFESSEASDTQANPPLDLTEGTPYITYNATCSPVLVASGGAADAPVKDFPVWQDISQKFDQYCGDCHSTTGSLKSSYPSAGNAFEYDRTQLNNFGSGSPVVELFKKRWVDVRFGANSSRAYWAARGERTDGRDNNKSIYQPVPADYSSCDGAGANGAAILAECGYKFSSVHTGLGYCGGGNLTAAKWVYDFGLWMDVGGPIDRNGTLSNGQLRYKDDRFHPSVDLAVIASSESACETPDLFNIGYWDNSNSVDIDIFINGAQWNGVNPGFAPNGNLPIPLSGVDLLATPDALVQVVATDPTGNIEKYGKTFFELYSDCVVSHGGSPPVVGDDDDDNGGALGDDDDDNGAIGDDDDDSGTGVGDDDDDSSKSQSCDDGAANPTFELKKSSIRARKYLNKLKSWIESWKDKKKGKQLQLREKLVSELDRIRCLTNQFGGSIEVKNTKFDPLALAADSEIKSKTALDYIESDPKMFKQWRHKGMKALNKVAKKLKA